MIYLDANATTPVTPKVFAEMEPYFTKQWGNPSSSYSFGSALRSAIEGARDHVACLVGAQPDEVIFTGCGTESSCTAFHAALQSVPQKRHIITSEVEHPSVLAICKALEPRGYTVTYLPVAPDGTISPLDVENAISHETALVSLMWANNETGVLFPVQKIAGICKSHNVLFHSDAVQVIGKKAIHGVTCHPDYLSITGHKLNGPKGVGALIARRGSPFTPLLAGGHQERGRRSGTENVPLIVGLGVAAKIAKDSLPAYETDVKVLRDNFENSVLSALPFACLNGSKDQRLSNTSNISFPGCNADALLMLLDEEGVCASSGSACLADSDAPSHVIKAMRGKLPCYRDMIRFSISATTQASELGEAAKIVIECAQTLREL